MSDLDINKVDPRIASFRGELSSKHDGLMARAKDQGRISGSINAPPVSQEEPYPFEMELRANYQQHVAELSQLAQPLLEGYHAEYSMVGQKLDRTDSEWKALAELERSCPTQTSDGGSASIDRGDTLEAHFELQGEHAIWVAEYEGKLVGARGLTVREAVLDGVPRRLCYSHFVRVLPAFQSQGLFQPLNAMALEGLQRSTDGIFAYMDPRNDAMRAAIGGRAAGGGWTVHAQRLAIRCSDHAIAGDARRASPSDAARVVGLVNASHGGEGFFSQYSERSLFQRLSRVPEAYSWSDLLVGEHAVAGLWNSAERRRTERAGVVRQSIRSPILDYGFEGEAGLDELVDLLGQWCHAALETGTTHLTLFSSKPSPGWGRLSALAEEIEAYEFPCFLPPPEDLEQCGLYVDAVFF